MKLQACNFVQTPTQLFSCKYCETFKNSFFHSTPMVTTSVFMVSTTPGRI